MSSSRGSTWADKVRAKYDLNESEDLLVDEIAAVLNVLDAGGLVTAEERQQRALLSRLLYQLNLPESGTDDRATLTTRKASRAARARWNREAV